MLYIIIHKNRPPSGERFFYFAKNFVSKRGVLKNKSYNFVLNF